MSSQFDQTYTEQLNLPSFFDPQVLSVLSSCLSPMKSGTGCGLSGLYPSIWRRMSCGSIFPSDTWWLQVHLALQMHLLLLLFLSPPCSPCALHWFPPCLASPFFSEFEEHCWCTALPTALPKLCNALFTGLLPASDIAPSLCSDHSTHDYPPPLLERANLIRCTLSRAGKVARQLNWSFATLQRDWRGLESTSAQQPRCTDGGNPKAFLALLMKYLLPPSSWSHVAGAQLQLSDQLSAIWEVSWGGWNGGGAGAEEQEEEEN